MTAKSIRSEVTSAGKWSAISTFVVTILQFARTIAIAKFLSPAEIGLYAMAMLAVNLFRGLADGGMANAIIYKQTSDRGIISSIHWINVALGVGVAFAVCLCSPLFAAYFNNSAVVSLVMLLSISPLTTSWVTAMQAVMRAELCFARLCIIRIVGGVVYLSVAVMAAWNGHGVYSIVYGVIANGIVDAVLTTVLAVGYSRPMLYFSREGLGEYVRFGGFQLGAQLVNFLSANADYFVIGRFLGEEALGIYRIAYELVIMPLARINPIVTQVVLPGFAKLKDVDRIRRAYLEVIRFLSRITLPCLFGLWAIAPLFVEVAYDARYQSAAELVRILTLVSIFKTLCNPIGVAMTAIGRVDVGFYWQVAVLLVSVPVFVLLAPYGVAALAWGYVFLMALGFWILNGPMLTYLLNARFEDVFRQLYMPVAISFSMAAIVVGATSVSMAYTSATTSLAIAIPLGVLCYVGLVAILDHQFLRSVFALVLHRD